MKVDPAEAAVASGDEVSAAARGTTFIVGRRRDRRKELERRHCSAKRGVGAEGEERGGWRW